MGKLIIYTDGGARNNPGPAGIGIVIKDETGNVLETHKEYIGEKTNNQAEYKALIKALEIVRGKTKKIDFFLDSQLVVNQLKGLFKVKNSDIRNYLFKIRTLEQKFDEITYTFIPREKNKHADKLVNQAIDEEIKTK